jgi:hypothetical protein
MPNRFELIALLGLLLAAGGAAWLTGRPAVAPTLVGVVLFVAGARRSAMEDAVQRHITEGG